MTGPTNTHAMLKTARLMRDGISIVHHFSPEGADKRLIRLYLYGMNPEYGWITGAEYERLECLMLASGRVVKEGNILKGSGK